MVISTHIVPIIESPIRLSDYLVGVFDQYPSRKSVKKALKKGAFLLNGSPADSGHWMLAGDKVQLLELEEPPRTIFELDLEIVFEDDYLAVINKPAGIPVSGNLFKTVKNALPGNLSPSPLPDALKIPKCVHRLDSQTSGLLIIAKTAKANIALGKMFEEKTISKTYAAVVAGTPEPSGKIDLQIEGKNSVTFFKKIQTVSSLRNEFVSLMKFSPKTGRTHQIRIHAASIGHPIVGDKLYGTEGEVLRHKGLFLAAVKLNFKHPILGESLEIAIDMPYKFKSYLEREARRWEKFNGETDSNI